MTVKTFKYAARAPRGFSLLEMVIVMGIIALILGGAIFMMGGIGESARVNQTKTDLQQYRTALLQYKTMTGNYPTDSQGLDALVSKPTSAPIPDSYVPIMDELTQDPWENDYVYKRRGSKKKNEPEVISAGPDGELGTEDDMSSQDR